MPAISLPGFARWGALLQRLRATVMPAIITRESPANEH